MGRSIDDILEAIHKSKRAIPKGAPTKNPDVVVDTVTGEIFPKGPKDTPGDSIGNIFDFLD